MKQPEHQYAGMAPPHDSLRESERPLCVLLIEDEPDHCDQVQDCFERYSSRLVELTCARTVEEACNVLDARRFDLVLLDHSLPDGTGSDVLERMYSALLTTPVIGLSTSSDPEVALADFRGGAIEFLEKHAAFRGDTLVRSVFTVLADYKQRLAAHSLQRVREDAEYTSIDEHILAAARGDALTGLLNRGAFDESHDLLHHAAAQSRKGYTLCLADIDMFKQFNDRYGHPAGDEALHQVATILKMALRPEDVIGRYGGEEIIIILGEADKSALPQVVERLRSTVQGLAITHADNTAHQEQLTISVGVAWCDRPDRELPSEVVARADSALYEAKAAGRNTFRIAEQSAHEEPGARAQP